jgi:hypothetical protein
MKTKLLSCLVLLFVLAACSKQGSIFSKQIGKDRGSLRILNQSGFIGATVAGTSLEHELVLFAAGGLNISDLSATLNTNDPISFSGGQYPGSGGTCGETLNSGATCTIVILYEPTSMASHRADLRIHFKDSLSSSRLDYVLTADSHPILTFEYGTRYDFGNKYVGTSTDLRIRVSNSGRVVAENITINNLFLPFSFKGGSYPGTGGDCSNRLAPGENCSIVINYSPTNNGEHLQDITLTYQNNGRPEQNSLQLLAWGFLEAQLSLTALGGDDFGTVASHHQHLKTLTVTHSGGDVAASQITLTGLTAPFARVGGTCGTTLAPVPGTCSIIVALEANSSANWSNNLSLSYFTGVRTVTINRGITGTTRLRPVLSISPETGPINFGVVKSNTTATRTFTVTYESGELPATEMEFTNLNSLFSRTGGTCSTSLSSGTCTIIIGYSPTSATTTSSLNTSFRYHNTITTDAPRNFTFTGSSEAKLTFNSLYPGSFGTVVSGETAHLNLRLNYSGGAAATGLTVHTVNTPFNISGGVYPGGPTSSPACGTTISGFCFVRVSFTPPNDGSFASPFTLRFHDGVEDNFVTINLTGTGTPTAVLTMEDKAYGITSVHSATEGPSRVRVTNTTSMTASSLSAVLPTGFSFRGGNYPGYNGTCGATLSGNGSCFLDILFTPTAATAYSGTLTLNYNNGTSMTQATSNLSGTGVNTSELYLSHYDEARFPTTFIGQVQPPLNLRLNHGGGASGATSITKVIASSDFLIISDNCSSSLSNGAGCDISVRFSPQAAGNREGFLEINYITDGQSRTISRRLTGLGRTPALLSVTPAPAAFGARPTGASYDLTLTVSRTGEVNATSMSRSLSAGGFAFKGGSYPGTGGTCPTLTMSASTCTIVVTFTPTSAISYSANLNLNYHNGYTNTSTLVNLTGSGIPTAQLTFSPVPVNFGQVIQTTSSERSVTMTNTGPVSATTIAPVTVAAPFVFKGGVYPGTGGNCGGQLASLASCTMVIEFAPTSTGVRVQDLIMNYDNGYASVQASVQLTGEGLAQAIISISDANPYDFGTVNLNQSITRMFTLSNSGSVAGTALSGSFIANFSFAGGSFPGTGGSCQPNLAAGAACTIVLSFTPIAATTYNGSFTLNYHDGLRVQTELKELRGTGSNALTSEYYLSLIPAKEFVRDSAGDVQQRKIGTGFLPSVSIKGMGLEGHFQEALYSTAALSPGGVIPEVEGVWLDQDLNGDGYNDVLIGLYKGQFQHYQLIGYDIICSRSGQIIQRYINPDGR